MILIFKKLLKMLWIIIPYNKNVFLLLYDTTIKFYRVFVLHVGITVEHIKCIQEEQLPWCIQYADTDWLNNSATKTAL